MIYIIFNLSLNVSKSILVEFSADHLNSFLIFRERIIILSEAVTGFQMKPRRSIYVQILYH